MPYPETGYIWDKMHNRDKLRLAKEVGLEHRGGECRLCGLKGEVLVLDHDHTSRLTRGFICQPCNVRLGYAEDPAGGGARYRRRHKAFVVLLNQYLEATVWAEEEPKDFGKRVWRAEAPYYGLKSVG